MRILSLHLERYGAFEGRDLVFPEGRLCVVFGANEAGKTSTLAALCDLLYGFPHSTPYDFRFDATQLRVGARLADANGQTLFVRRRKGRSRTLLTADDGELGDDALAPFIGRSDRSLFEKAFGLSHERLRAGGDAMLKAGGDIGESLIEAGSGIPDLLRIQERLHEQADALYSVERKVASKPIFQSYAAYDAARKARNTASLSADKWRQAVRAEEDAKAELKTVRRQVAEARDKAQLLGRLKRVLPILRELDRIRDDIDRLGPVPELDQDAENRRARASETRARARRDKAGAEEQLNQIDKWLADHPVAEAMIAQAQAIDELHGRIGEIRASLRDIPIRNAELRAETDQLRELARRLGFECDRPLAERQPDDLTLARFEELIREGERLEQDRHQISQDLARARDELEKTDEAIASIQAGDDPTADLRTVQRLRRQERDDVDLAELDAGLEDLERRIGQDLSRLTRWDGDLEGLLRLPLPSASTIRQFSKRLAAREQELRVADEKAERASQDLEQARHRLDVLTGGGGTASPEMLETARAEREQAWSAIKRRYIERVPVEPESTDVAKAGEPPEQAYEQRVARADAIADRMRAEAGRLADQAGATAALAGAERALSETGTLGIAARDALESVEEDWKQLWVKLSIVPGSPDEMAEWTDTVEAIRGLANTRDEQSTRAKALRDRVDMAKAEAAALMERRGGEPANGTIAAMLERLTHHLEQCAEDRQRVRDLTGRRRDREQMVARADQRSKQTDSALNDWKEHWEILLAKLGHAPDLSLAAGSDSLTLWRTVLGAAGEAAKLKHRIDAMEEGRERFDAEARALAEIVAPDLSGPTGIELTGAIFRRLREAEETEATRRERLRQQRQWRKSFEEAERQLLESDAILTDLMRRAEAEDEAALEREIERAGRKRALLFRLTETRERLVSAGDGFGEARLREDAGDWDSAALEAAILENETEVQALEARHDEALREGTRQAELLRQLNAQAGANEAAQKAQSALAQLSNHAHDWVRFRAASLILKTSIDRFRERHQTPLLERAGTLFKALTNGSFQRFAVDFGENDEPRLVGERTGGEHVQVAGMSDGTRDQLYLALRLAALEAYCAKEEPLPFIGDDLFVHFDDERATAGLRLLGSQTACQVLLFTHHRHMVALAEQTFGKACKVIEI